MAYQTQAIVSRDSYDEGGWKLEDVIVREPGEGELLVEMTASGICHSDITAGSAPKDMAPGHYPHVFGHEGSGYVKAIGPGVTIAKVGDPVLCSFAICGECFFCKRGEGAHCDAFFSANVGHYEKIFSTKEEDASKPSITGAFFGHSSFSRLSIVKQGSVVNAVDLIKSKEELQLFSPLGCGFQTGSGSIANVAKAGPDDVVCVLGLGGVGFAAVMTAKLLGVKQIIGIDKVDSRLELGKELGCTDVINSSTLPEGSSLGEVVRGITEGVGPTITVDTTGVPFLMEAGLAFTRRSGKFLQVGIPKDPSYDTKINVRASISQGVWWIGALEGWATPREYIPKMIQWYREGVFPIEKLSKFFKIEQWDEGVKGMLDGTVIKPIVVF